MNLSLLNCYRPTSLNLTNELHSSRDDDALISPFSSMTGVCVRSDPAAATCSGGRPLAAGMGSRAIMVALSAPTA